MMTMGEVIAVEDYIDDQFVRRVHLMSNTDGFEYPLPEGVEAKVTKEAGIYHLRAEWAVREAFAGVMIGSDRFDHHVVLWSFDGERVSKCIRDAAREFGRVFSRQAQFAAVRSYPESMGLDVDVEVDGGAVVLVVSADVPRGFVMVF